MAQRKPETVTLTVCDRCDAVLTRTVTSTDGSGQSRKEVKRESFGPVSCTVGGSKGIGKVLFEYEEICGRCKTVIERIVKKCGKVKRGGRKNQEGEEGEAIDVTDGVMGFHG